MAGLLVIGVAACGLCETEEVGRVCAEGGGRCAVMEVRSCGATTGFSTRVRVADGWFGGGTVLVVDDQRGAVAVGPRREVPLRVRWVDRGRLRIEVPARAAVYRQETRAGAVAVEVRLVTE